MTSVPQKVRQLSLWNGEIAVSPLTGGLSNESYIVTDQTGKFIARFCEDIPVHHVNRNHEAMVSQAAAKAGFAPEMVHYSPGVMVFEFIDAKTYGQDDIRPKLEALVERVKAFHTDMRQHVSGTGQIFWVFHVIADYARTLKKDESRFADKLEMFTNVATQLEKVQVPQPIVITHNDLLPANFMDDGKKIWLIDFEYAGFGTAMFDLANLSANAEFSLNEDKELLQLYFGAEPSGEICQSLAAMKCASALREAMWSMVSELHLSAPGVNYSDYIDECLPAFYRQLETYQSKYGNIA